MAALTASSSDVSVLTDAMSLLSLSVNGSIKDVSEFIGAFATKTRLDDDETKKLQSLFKRTDASSLHRLTGQQLNERIGDIEVAQLLWQHIHPVPSIPIPRAFNKGHSLVETSGSGWQYQVNPDWNIKEIRSELCKHYQAYLAKNQDKQSHAVFLSFAGAGMGKSRLLEEFQQILFNSLLSPVPPLGKAGVSTTTTSIHETKETKGENDLRKRITTGAVFRITFGNGSLWNSSGEDRTPSELVGTRMAHQLFNGKRNIAYPEFRDENRYSIKQALELLERITGIPRNQQTVILLIDELSLLPHSHGDSKSLMASVMTEVTSYVNSGPEYVIAAMAGTVHSPVDDWLHKSRQMRVQLTPAHIDDSRIIRTDDPIIRILANDMGGHGRALERLSEVLQENKWYIPATDTYDSTAAGGRAVAQAELFVQVREKLRPAYRWNDITDLQFTPILIAALTGRKFKRTDTIAGTGPGDGFTIDEILSFGLVRLSSNHQLDIPYILVALFSLNSNDPILTKFPFHGSQSWEEFERFIANHMALRSKLFGSRNGKNETLLDYHSGVRWNDDDILRNWDITHRAVKRVVQSTHQCLTSSDSKDPKQYGIGYDDEKDIVHETATHDATYGTSVVINGASASAGDVFRIIELTYTGRQKKSMPTHDQPVLVYEVAQCKKVKSGVNLTNYITEMDKATSDRDVFILFTTSKTDVFMDSNWLPQTKGQRGRIAGIVDWYQWHQYFGPYAGRAFLAAQYGPNGRVNINIAIRSQLMTVKGVGSAHADTIITDRDKNGRFKNATDARERLQLPVTVDLTEFDYS